MSTREDVSEGHFHQPEQRSFLCSSHQQLRNETEAFKCLKQNNSLQNTDMSWHRKCLQDIMIVPVFSKMHMLYVMNILTLLCVMIILASKSHGESFLLMDVKKYANFSKFWFPYIKAFCYFTLKYFARDFNKANHKLMVIAKFFFEHKRAAVFRKAPTWDGGVVAWKNLTLLSV